MPRKRHWFRFYSRMIDSPQILELNDSEFRLIVSIWCLVSESEENGKCLYSIRALHRRVMPDKTEEEVATMIDHLKKLDLLAGEDGDYEVPRWELLQSDYDYQTRLEWTIIRKELSPLIFKRDNFKCQYCGSNRHLTVDHIIPISRGGTNEVSNLITACRSCNSKKHDKTPWEMRW